VILLIYHIYKIKKSLLKNYNLWVLRFSHWCNWRLGCGTV